MNNDCQWLEISSHWKTTFLKASCVRGRSILLRPEELGIFFHPLQSRSRRASPTPMGQDAPSTFRPRNRSSVIPMWSSTYAPPILPGSDRPPDCPHA